MARTIDHARRAELAARAFDVIRKRGVGRTTMSDLAAELGIKRPTLYFYFKDLGAVFDVVFEETHRRYLAQVAPTLAGVAHPIDLLTAILRQTVEFHQGERDRIVLLFQLWAVGGAEPDHVIARGRELSDPLRAGLVAQVAAGVASGLVAPCDPARVVDLVLTVLDGALVQAVTRAAPAAAVVDEFEQRVLRPLRREPRRAAAATTTARPRARPRSKS